MSIKFNKHNVTDTETKVKARVFYSANVHALTGRECVTVYAKDFSRNLREVFPAEYVNNTDSQSDYFDEGKVTFYPEHPHYEAAKARADQNAAEYAAKYAR